MLSPSRPLERSKLHRLQAIDRSLIGAPALYLASNEPITGQAPLMLHKGDWVGSGTFRNSLYIDIWKQLSRIRDLWLQVDAQGSLSLKVMLVVPGQPARELAEHLIEAPERGQCAISVALLADLPEGSRLFWHVEALTDAVLHEVIWSTRSAPAEGLRLAVLMRTYGRAGDLRAQLQRYADAACDDEHYASLLERCDFWVLDSSDAPDADWQDAAELGLNLRLLAGPNLGGGGNASHLIARFLAANEAAAPENQATEVLIVDDDMSLSMESLARYLASCSWRRTEYVTSLPVLMKSRPTTVWEDGGFWGRKGFDVALPGGLLRELSPQLLRHGLNLDGFEHLDQFGPLNRCEYSTFIFFGLPLSLLKRLGLPAAFFLRGDDIEYSLRALRLGVPLITNPNLAAWHEPGHGYGQEYMAILHGCITNLEYSDNQAEQFLSFFERRMMEHLAAGDADGLALYQQVLEDLLDGASPVLAQRFDEHYKRLLPTLGARMTAMTVPELERLQKQAGPVQLIPYLYPGFTPVKAEGQRQALLVNSSGPSYRALPVLRAAQRLEIHQRFVATLQRFEAQFEDMRVFWRARLVASGQPAFWQSLLERHASQTRSLGRFQFGPVADPVAGNGVVRAAPRRRSPAREQAGANGVRVGRSGDAWLSRLVRRFSPAADASPSVTASNKVTAPALPGDFNPTLYLSLHADVARTGIDPSLHYLRYGRQEGRRYRS